MESNHEHSHQCCDEKTIGVAWIDEDGTISMQLHASQGGIHGHGLLRYGVADPHYAEILAHIGPIKPGEKVTVLPFPE